jgi:hypothetical protein
MLGGNLSSKLREQRNLAHAQAAEGAPTPASQTLPLDCHFEVTVVLRIWTPSCTGVVPRENIFRTVGISLDGFSGSFLHLHALLSAVGLRHSREESHGAEVSTILNAAAAFSDQPRLF